MASRGGSGFKIKKELDYADVIKITTGPPAQRSRKEILAVTDWIMKRTPLFADMDKDIVYNVMKSCKCQITLRDTVVVKQGDKGDAFYIILRGQVSVFVKEEEKKSLLSELLESEEEQEKTPSPEAVSDADDSDKEEQAKPTGPSVRLRFRKTLTKLKVTQQITPKMKKRVEKPDPRKTLGLKVAQMGDGKSFGELALQNSDNKRAASCVTDTEVVFLVVARDSYNKSIRSYHRKQLELIKGFIGEHPFFAHWTNRLKLQVQNSVTQLKLQVGETVLRQGQTYNGMYFLIQGEVKVVVNSQNHAKQYSELMNSTGPGKKQGVEETPSQNRLLGHLEILRSLSQPHVHVKRREGYSAAELQNNVKHRSFCLSGPTITFGEIEHILGVNTYMQTIMTESTARLFHINKENLCRLIKLASNMGQMTLTAMAEQAYHTWMNRIENFATTSDDLSCLDEIIKNLEHHPMMRVKNAVQSVVSKEDQVFESLLKAYLCDQAPLIQPCVEGGYNYRMEMQEKADLRRKQRARRGNIQMPRSLRPLRNNKIPRSIATLKEQIKKYNTSDVDIIVPSRRRSIELDPLKPEEKEQPKIAQQNAGRYQYGAAGINTSQVNEGIAKANNLQISDENASPMMKVSSTTKPLLDQIPEQDETEHKSMPQPRSEPVLITERAPKCDDFSLVEGKTLKFYSQYLKGRLDEQYNQSVIDPEIIQNNRDAEIIEEKLQKFINPEDVVPEQKATICKLRRLDESQATNILPGAKCLIERTPCRLLRKSFPLRAHEHVRRHMIEH